MAVQDPNGDGYFAAVPLETEDHAATVEVAAGMVLLKVLGPVTTQSVAFARGEARTTGVAVIDASQHIEEETR
jgi:hypothetical protein